VILVFNAKILCEEYMIIEFLILTRGIVHAVVGLVIEKLLLFMSHCNIRRGQLHQLSSSITLWARFFFFFCMRMICTFYLLIFLKIISAMQEHNSEKKGTELKYIDLEEKKRN